MSFAKVGSLVAKRRKTFCNRYPRCSWFLSRFTFTCINI